jgi:FlaA1/EpsC-like NDP-sugar epimerase
MRNRYILLGDFGFIVIAAFGAFALRLGWFSPERQPEFLPFLAAALLVKPAVFYLLGLYRRLWRYASVQDLIAVTVAVTAASVAMAVVVAAGLMSRAIPIFSRSILPIDWMLTLVLTGGLRMSVRIAWDSKEKIGKAPAGSTEKVVLVVGAGDAGTIVTREIQRNPHLGMVVSGFLDDAPEKQNKWIQGIKVLGPLSTLPEVASRQRLAEVIIAMPTASGAVIRHVADSCLRLNLVTRIVPGVYELLDGVVTVNRLRKIEITDLLRRSQVVGQASPMPWLTGRRAMVTGAGGSIGSELCRQVAFARPSCLVLLGHGENSIFELQCQLAERYPDLRIHPVIADIRDHARIKQVFADYLPSTVFHAAAHKHVPLMEINPAEAITNNVLGTLNVADAAVEYGTERFILISTDKAVHPTNIMGVSKRIAEMIVRDAARRSGQAFLVVRFGNVLGSRGSVVPVFQRQIERGGPITVTHPDMARFFMTIPESVHLVLEAGGIGRGGELFVLKMGKPLRIVDLASDLVRLSGLEPDDIPIVFSGVRPGEKLEEELWEAGATVEATPNPEILRVIEPEQRQLDLSHIVKTLQLAAERGDRAVMEAAFVRVVPTWTPPSGTGVVH